MLLDDQYELVRLMVSKTYNACEKGEQENTILFSFGLHVLKKKKPSLSGDMIMVGVTQHKIIYLEQCEKGLKIIMETLCK